MNDILILRMLKKLLVSQGYGNSALVEEATAVINGKKYDRCATCSFYCKVDGCMTNECVRDEEEGLDNG
jgi:hypothetical protein